MLDQLAPSRGGQPAPDTSGWPASGPPGGVPEMMTAAAFDRFGPPEVLQLRSVPTPRPGPDEILVRVGAVSVGRLLDLSSRAGTHPFAGFRLPHVLGAEHSGTIAELGSAVTSVAVGGHVAVFPVITCGECAACLMARSEGCSRLEILGVHRPGAYAEYSLVPARNVRVVPPGIGAGDAAALALAGPVAMNQLAQAGLAAGDWVLVQGAASALGSLTVALAQHLGGRVIATSRSERKRQALAKLGASATLDPTADDFVERVMAITGGQGVQIAIDDLGEPRIWTATMACLAVLGTVVSSGAFLGGQVHLDLMSLYLRSQRVLGVRTGTPASGDALWSVVADGFRPVVDSTFPLQDAAAAHRYLEDDQSFGRVLLAIDVDCHGAAE